MHKSLPGALDAFIEAGGDVMKRESRDAPPNISVPAPVPGRVRHAPLVLARTRGPPQSNILVVVLHVRSFYWTPA
jgi:hypothetical protein